MKQFYLIGLLGFSVLLSGCSSDQGNQNANESINQSKEHPAEEVSVYQDEKDNTSKTDLATGTSTVLATVEKLKNTIENSPDDINKINELGKDLSENWDLIEKKVEKRYPKDYKDIEESLYPLIAFAQNDSPDIEKMKQLIKEVNDKLTSFKQKVSS